MSENYPMRSNPAPDDGKPLLASLSISNYRRLESVKLDPLSRINLITGDNSTGKTSVLEAAFLLAWVESSVAQNAYVLRVDRRHVGRKMVGAAFSHEDNARALWGPLFSRLDMSKPIEIAAVHRACGRISLRVQASASSGPGSRTTVRHLDSRPRGPLGLQFLFRHAKGTARSAVSANGKMTEPTWDGQPLDIPATLVVPGFGQSGERRMAQVLRRKREPFVVESLQIVEPRLTDIRTVDGPGGHGWWGDIGLEERVPLPVVGDGFEQMANLAVTLAHDQRHIVLIDEIERGYHYTKLEDMWRVVCNAAQQFDAQVIATTHSRDCVVAAYRASRGERFGLHRLEVHNDSIRCVTYDDEAIEGAIHHNIEVR